MGVVLMHLHDRQVKLNINSLLNTALIHLSPVIAGFEAKFKNMIFAKYFLKITADGAAVAKVHA